MKNLEKNLPNLKNVYRLTGDDVLMIEKALHIIQDACNISFPELNVAVFDDENFNAQEIVLSCEQMPFVSDKRLVLVKNILKIKDSEIKILEQYALNPVLSTVLVFVEVVGNNVFSKLTAEKVLCKKLSSEELQKFVKEEFEKENKKISLSAVNLLVDFCGNDLLRIKNELTKLLNYKNEIDDDDIKKLVKKSDDFSIFEISTALTYGQGDKAIKLMNKMLETMEFPVILGLISSHFRRMLYAVLSDATPDEIANNLGVKGFAISKARTLAKNLKPMQILKINNIILDVDYDIKMGKMAVDNAMFYLVFKITNIIKGGK